MADPRNLLDPKDYKYLRDEPDPDFSPERNQAIVKETIQQTEKFFSREGKVVDDAQKERVDILSTYAVYRFNRGTKDFISYYGKDNYYKLVGEKIMSKVRVADTVNRLRGNNKFQKGILL